MRVLRGLGMLLSATGTGLIAAGAVGSVSLVPSLLGGFALVVGGAALAGVARALGSPSGTSNER